MEIGNKINQLRKLSGMTQEQLAEKLNVSRQTISKWESDSTSPDLESIVKISRIFHVSLDDLLKEGEAGVANKTDEQITLEDLMKINLHNRKMTLLLISGLIFIMVSILNFAYVIALQSTTLSTQYPYPAGCSRTRRRPCPCLRRVSASRRHPGTRHTSTRSGLRCRPRQTWSC